MYIYKGWGGGVLRISFIERELLSNLWTRYTLPQTWAGVTGHFPTRHVIEGLDVLPTTNWAKERRRTLDQFQVCLRKLEVPVFTVDARLHSQGPTSLYIILDTKALLPKQEPDDSQWLEPPVETVKSSHCPELLRSRVHLSFADSPNRPRTARGVRRGQGTSESRSERRGRSTPTRRRVEPGKRHRTGRYFLVGGNPTFASTIFIFVVSL